MNQAWTWRKRKRRGCKIYRVCSGTCFKIPSDECVGVILDFFFNSTAKTLAIYREFWYFSRIFPTLFSQLISIFMIPLHTFSMGVKIDARLRQERTVRLHYA